MTIPISRSEKKRQAKNIEKLSQELSELSASDINKLPCDDFLKDDIKSVRKLKAGSRKRQIKYIAKELRGMDVEPFLDFLTEKKGSRLKQAGEFHELERIRDEIITEAMGAREEADEFNTPLTERWQSDMITAAAKMYPALDTAAVKKSALQFSKSRKPVHSREIFRLLRAAQEQLRFQQAGKE